MPTRAELNILINDLIRATAPGDKITSLEHRQANQLILDYVDQQNAVPGNYGIVGGTITWSGVGLLFYLSNFRYLIGGNGYIVAAHSKTLNPAHATLDRIDLFVGTTASTIIVIEGTPSATPLKPSINPATQIELGFALVPAASLVPGNISNVYWYDENVGESTPASDVVLADYSFSTAPSSGGVSTLIPGHVDGKFLSYRKASTYPFADFQFMVFDLWLNAAQSSTNFLSAYLFNDTLQIGGAVNINLDAYGYDETLVGAWQTIVIPINQFFSMVDPAITTFDKIYFRMNGNNASGFKIDKLFMQSNASAPGSGVVLSFNGRTGNVLSAEGDYKVNVANFAAMPATGSKAKIYITDDDGSVYQWNGTGYDPIGSGGGATMFLGVYASLVALQTAHPTASAGNYAQVDPGAGNDLVVYYWDADDDWVATSGSSPAASETVAGIAEIATQAETNTGTDDLRIVTPLKMETRVQALLGALPATPVKATAAELNTGADDAKFATALGLQGSKYLNRDGTKIYAVATGTDTYAAALTPALTAYAAGQTFQINFTNANTTAATINVDGLGAKNIYRDSTTALNAGDITAGKIVQLVYDGTNFQMIGASAPTESNIGNKLFNYYNFR